MDPGLTPLQRVLIVGKTRMGAGVCVGGITSARKPVRLLPVGKHYHLPDTPFKIGDIWEMRLRPRAVLEPPHMEDHDEWDARKRGQAPDLFDLIPRVARVFGGDATGLFGGMLRFRPTGSGFLPRGVPSPAWSVEFWRLPRQLRLDPDREEARYVMFKPVRFSVPYVGHEPRVPVLPSGTLVRMSMARWHVNQNAPQEGETCALMMSGWFGIPPP